MEEAGKTSIPGYIEIINNGIYSVTYSQNSQEYIFSWVNTNKWEGTTYGR